MYKQYVEKLALACAKQKWKLSRKKLNADYDFLSVRVNEGAPKKICFSAGIHGDEPAGPEAILKFIEEGKVPDDVFVMFHPVVNPWGFDKGSRANVFRQDINRRFCDKLLAGEAKAAYGMLKKYPVNLFCSMHEWSGKDGFYMYASDKIRKEEIIKVPQIASRWFEVFDKKRINDELVEGGVIWHPDGGYDNNRSRCTLENKMFEDKVHYVCLETPSQAELADRTSCQFQIMEYLLELL